LVPSAQTTVVVEFEGTTTVVFAGGGGLLLLMQPDKRNGASTARLARIFIGAHSSLLYDASIATSVAASLALQDAWRLSVWRSRPYSGAHHQIASVDAYG
jgi:hypothetical protein